MTDEKSEKKARPSWQEIHEMKINMVKERGSRVLKINSPLGSTLFNILRQFDMAYAHFKARLGEMDGISHEEGELLMAEGRDIVMAFSDYTAKLSKRIRFRYYTPREISEFMKTEQRDGNAE
ncbi:MAG: recombinase [Deltaproteobacteria bacterium]